jgi:hypothetical protein
MGGHFRFNELFGLILHTLIFFLNLKHLPDVPQQ